MDSKFISTPSGKFHAIVAGEGAPVILIHGYSVRNSWRTWVENIAALAEVARVYALDLLGYGESDTPEPALDAPRQANAIIELLDAENLERAAIVGLSWGGGIAQMIATTAPTRVSKLVLVDSTYSAKPENLARLKTLACPTLIVWDEDDARIPVAGAQVLGDAIPNARVRIFKREERDPDADPNNRHWSQVSHSREWNRLVADFLRDPKGL
ncbi:MAG: alpha/beta fold hydrolase [Chloroflexi bacterium]|nr:alpha/beta fold hydrolase [Chloroflexota bacterium]